jgi:hypothetical protein
MIDAGRMSKRSIAVDSNLSSSTLRSRITVSRDLKKYFRHISFFSCYDADIVANKSILCIPVLSMVLPFAWITGADVYVDELDRTFAESMNTLQHEYEKMYPGAPFKTRLVADRLVDNKHAPNNTALVFSGGLDSTYSLFSHLDARPILIMILGTVDIPLSNVAFQRMLEREYSDFAEREGLVLSFIRTNAIEILDMRRVDHLFWKFKGRLQGGYWNGIGYSLGQIGQVAPLSVGRFSHLLVAGALGRAKAYDERTKAEYPDASYPSTDETIMWANICVRHDANIPRHQKASALKQFLDARELKLRSCSYASDLHSQTQQSPRLPALNCNQCPKCLRTIAELTLAGIDPNKCGFGVERSTFNRIRTLFRRRSLTLQDIALWWKPLQEAIRTIPSEIEGDPYGAKQFFEWFKTIELASAARPRDSPLSNIYRRLPYAIANPLRVVWERIPARLAANTR